MTAQIIDGKAIAASIRASLKQDVADFKENHPLFSPALAVVQVGARPDSAVYVRMKRKAAEEIGASFYHLDLPEAVSQEELLSEIQRLNNDSRIHGIIVQLPLPGHLDPKIVTNAVNPAKDVDGFTSYNIGELSKRHGQPYFLPCTPKGVIDLLKQSNIPVGGKHAVVLGRSERCTLDFRYEVFKRS